MTAGTLLAMRTEQLALIHTLLFSLTLAPGCEGTQSTSQPDPKYPPKTTMRLKTARCSGTSCICRRLDADDDQGEDGIRPGYKRFEFRLPRSTSAIWIAAEGRGYYYKAPEKVLPSCFYLDLPNGKIRLLVHSENRDPEVGLQTGLTIIEHGVKNGPNWYKVFDFSCGGMNKCTKLGMKTWVAFMRKLPRNLLNPCGSVKIKKVSVSGSHKQRGDVAFADMTLDFTLDIYNFEPYKDSSSQECQGVTAR